VTAAARRRPGIVDDTPELRARLSALWETAPGFVGALSSVDHKEIGLRYIVTAFVLLALGGLEALALRLQLAGPDLSLLTPEQYNQLFSTHGMTMIFLYAAPVLSGFSNYFWPLLLGARDMAFPRLNALSYWVYLASALFLYAGFVVGAGPNDGWFNYPPYSELPYNPGLNQDFYALGMVLLGISTTVGAANFVVTAFKMRAPGMSVNRMPILVWGTLTASVANLVVVPAVSLAFFMLWLDRQFGTRFFVGTGDGQPLLWQHLFWFFGHPWVYAIVLPAMGMVSDGLPVLCRRPLVGYSLVALGTVGTMVIGFGVWVHHMFATGLPGLSLAFFSGASILITFPSLIAIFSWLGTIWTGRPVYTTAFMFFASVIVLFVIGGVSGIMTGSVPVDWQLTDTYFVVAHLHYVLIGINVFPVVGATYFWFPKMTGRRMDERLGRWNFWTMFLGFNLGFLPMHVIGLLGMPRRVYTYPQGARLGRLEPRDLDRRVRVRGRRAAVLRQRLEEPPGRRARRRGSLGRLDARVVDALAAAALQLRGRADDRLAAPAVGGRARPRPDPQLPGARDGARRRPRGARDDAARRRARADRTDAGRHARAARARGRTPGAVRRTARQALVARRPRRPHHPGRAGRVALATAQAARARAGEARSRPWLSSPSPIPGNCRSGRSAARASGSGASARWSRARRRCSRTCCSRTSTSGPAAPRGGSSSARRS
jgi:heme/copper-type cytochrome/quinol oxidase subunit 1